MIEHEGRTHAKLADKAIVTTSRQAPDQRFRDAAEEFSRWIIEELGDQLDVVVLFGSVAKDAANEDSDIGILVVSTGGEATSKAITTSSASATKAHVLPRARRTSTSFEYTRSTRANSTSILAQPLGT